MRPHRSLISRPRVLSVSMLVALVSLTAACGSSSSMDSPEKTGTDCTTSTTMGSSASQSQTGGSSGSGTSGTGTGDSMGGGASGSGDCGGSSSFDTSNDGGTGTG